MNREREWEGDGERERDTKTMRSRRKKNSEDSGQEQGWVMGTQIEVEKGEVEGKKMCVFQSRRLQCANHKLCLEHNGVLHNCSIAAPPPPPMKARSLTPNMNTNKHVCLLSGCPGRSPLLWDTFSNNPCKQFSPERSRLWWGYFLSHRYFFARHAIATGCICFRDWLEFPYLHCCGSIAGDP